MRKFRIIKEEELNKYSNLFNKEDIILPKRQTSNSCGYDFYLPYEVTIKAHEKTLIYTGVKIELENRDYLMVCIRSSMAVKKGLNLTNQVGIIDSDYYNNCDNDGHIMIAIINNSDSDVTLNKHDRIAQGIIMNYLICDEEENYIGNNCKVRTGGFGSTK